MKIICIALLCAVVCLCMVVSHQAKDSKIESEKDEDFKEDEPLSHREKQKELETNDRDQDKRFSPRPRFGRPPFRPRCRKWTHREYMHKLRELGLNIPYVKIQKASSLKVAVTWRKKGHKNILSYKCNKRIHKRLSGLHNLCNPCKKIKEEVIHPAINAIVTIEEVDCKSEKCIKIGNIPLGVCKASKIPINLPVPNHNCDGIVFKTMELKVACVCKAYKNWSSS